MVTHVSAPRRREERANSCRCARHCCSCVDPLPCVDPPFPLPCGCRRGDPCARVDRCCACRTLPDSGRRMQQHRTTVAAAALLAEFPGNGCPIVTLSCSTLRRRETARPRRDAPRCNSTDCARAPAIRPGALRRIVIAPAACAAVPACARTGIRLRQETRATAHAFSARSLPR